jgi:AcrR family transcriptional regulator
LEDGVNEAASDDPRHVDRGVARRQAFLQAARDVFLEQGFEAASVNDVVRRAGGSLATLYAQFGNKEGLFLAVAQDQQERFVRSVTPECVDHLPLDQGLQKIGEQFLRSILSKDNLAFFRVVIGEGRKFPQLLQRYNTSGADRVRAMVADYLKMRAAELEDHEAAGGYFIEIVRGKHHYRALSSESYRLTDADITAHVAACVRFFVRAAPPLPV